MDFLSFFRTRFRCRKPTIPNIESINVAEKVTHPTPDEAEVVGKHETTEFQVGQEMVGVITGILDYGIFVRLSPKEVGLVYKSDIQWDGQNKTYRCGQKVKVKVLGFKAGRGLSLSIKRAYLRELFDEFRSTHQVGLVVEGTIGNVKDYGLFVVLAPGVQGFAHASDTENFSSYTKYSKGESIKVEIIDIEEERMRIQLRTKGVVS